MAHPCWKLLLWMSLIIMGASILVRDGDAVSLPRRELDEKCNCSSPPPFPPVVEPPPPPPSTPAPPFCPPPPNPPYTPAPPYLFGPPAELYPVDHGYNSHGAGRSSIGWLPMLVGCGLLALWL